MSTRDNLLQNLETVKDKLTSNEYKKFIEAIAIVKQEEGTIAMRINIVYPTFTTASNSFYEEIQETNVQLECSLKRASICVFKKSVSKLTWESLKNNHRRKSTYIDKEMLDEFPDSYSFVDYNKVCTLPEGGNVSIRTNWLFATYEIVKFEFVDNDITHTILENDPEDEVVSRTVQSNAPRPAVRRFQPPVPDSDDSDSEQPPRPAVRRLAPEPDSDSEQPPRPSLRQVSN